MFLINILLVDDHALFSKSLEIALSDYSEIETFDSINDVSQLDNYIVSKKPDIILMDINLKNISPEDGLELAKQILSCYPEQRVVILSGYDLPVYPEAVRRLIYTTNAIEGFNRQLRKVTKSKTVFPSDDSLLKMLYLATMDITKKWTGHRQDW